MFMCFGGVSLKVTFLMEVERKKPSSSVVYFQKSSVYSILFFQISQSIACSTFNNNMKMEQQALLTSHWNQQMTFNSTCTESRMKVYCAFLNISPSGHSAQMGIKI